MAKRNVSPQTKGYGQGIAGWQFPEGGRQTIGFRNAGVNFDASPMDIEEGESPDAVDVRFVKGGITTDFDVKDVGAVYAGAGDKEILTVVEFIRENQTNVLVRMRFDGWDRWNGTAWLELTNGTPSLAGAVTDYYSVVGIQDRLCAANKGANRIMSWAGADGNTVQELDANAPRAWYLTRFGNRLVAARIDDGAGSVNPHQVVWSADGDVTEWVSATLGAGNAILLPQGPSTATDFINGLSTIESSIILYRERTITIGVQTGIGAAPFRFETPMFGIGTEAPYSIANGGPKIGDFFVGQDLNVYNFDGRNPPIPLGTKIHDWLSRNVSDPEKIIGIIDTKRRKYWMFLDGLTGDKTAWILDVEALLTRNYISWSRRELPDTYRSIGFGKTAASGDPVIDTVTDIIDTVGIPINEFSAAIVFPELVFGDSLGQVRQLNTNVPIPGTFVTKVFGSEEEESTVDKVTLFYSSPAGASVTVSISFDGGITFVNPRIFTLPTNVHQLTVTTDLRITGHLWQLKFQITSGTCTISKAHVTIIRRGPIAA